MPQIKVLPDLFRGYPGYMKQMKKDFKGKEMWLVEIEGTSDKHYFHSKAAAIAAVGGRASDPHKYVIRKVGK